MWYLIVVTGVILEQVIVVVNSDCVLVYSLSSSSRWVSYVVLWGRDGGGYGKIISYFVGGQW
jgi:hypothetical protein